MDPVIPGGARVRVRATRLPWPGDVIAVGRDDGQTLVHRVVGYRLTRSGLAVVTCSDRARDPDPPTHIVKHRLIIPHRRHLSFSRRGIPRPWTSSIGH